MSTAHRPRVIELLGPPASGKSTIAAALERLPGVVVVKDHRPTELPTLAWSALRAVPVLRAERSPGASRARWAAWVGRAGAAPAIVRRRVRRGARAVVLDQGPVYTLGRLCELAHADPAFAAWCDARAADYATLLDAVVMLDGDDDELVRRLRDRTKTHPAQFMGSAAAAAFVGRQRTTCRRTVDVLTQAGVPVVRLNGERTLEQRVAAVTALLDAPVAGGQR